MTNPTPPGQVPESLPAIQRFEVVDCIDSKHVPAVIPNASGPWVRYEDHAAQIAALTAAPAQPVAQQEAQEPATINQKTMELAESVGLIGPASRVGDLHAAIQRFHDLICVNATIKAAVMAADVIRGVATPARDYPPLPMQFACSGMFPVYSADQMRAYVDADRAAYAPAESVPAPVLDSLLNIVIHHEARATPEEVRSMAAELATYRAARAPAESVTAPADDALRAKVVSLTRDCCRQASKIAELGADLKFQEEKHREDRARLQTLYEHQRGECWYWQGDGQDHLESLCNTLPVVIRADQLRELVSTPPAQAADSVLEDAAPQAMLSPQVSVSENTLLWWRELATANPQDLVPRIDSYLDAARKQGANHD